MEIVRSSCCPAALYRNHKDIAKHLYGECAMLLRRVYGLGAYDFFFFLYNSELNKIVEATATLLRP